MPTGANLLCFYCLLQAVGKFADSKPKYHVHFGFLLTRITTWNIV